MNDILQPSESLNIWLPNLSDLLDESGQPRTQSIFLEVGYTSNAIYTLKNRDYEYKGNLYRSLGKLYVAENDPTEYEFATKYLLGWKHWERICENKLLRKFINEWREELEIKIRSQAIKEMINQSAKGKIAASRFLADRGWAQRGAGRPTTAEITKEKALKARVADEYGEDVARLQVVK